MSAHIKQINRQARLIKPVVAERVATQTFAGNKFPFCGCRAIGQRFGQERAHIFRRTFGFLLQMFFAGGKRGVGGIALHGGLVSIRMMLDASDQLNRIRQFHKVIIGAQFKRLGFGQRFFARGKNHQRGLRQRGVFAIISHQCQAIDIRHDQILKYDCWF